MEIRCVEKLSLSRRIVNEIFMLLVAALLLTGGGAAQESCDAANALLKAQLYEDALANYTALLKQDPKLDCAQTGILAVQRAQAIKSYELGQAYENASQVDLARNAYIEALKKNQTFTKAQDALARIALARISDPFAEVRTLANTGLYTEAVDRFKKVVENNPNISVPEDLKYLFGGKISPWRWLKFQIEPWIRPIIEILVVIVIFVLAGFGIYYRIYPWISGFCNPQLDIVDFDKGTSGLDIGKGLKALVEESYTQLGEGNPRVHLVDKPLDKLEIPADIKGAPYFKIVSQFIEWVFPQNVITLSGYLQAPGNLGAGMTLALVNSRTGEIVANHTIWQKDFDPTMTQQVASESKDPTPYYRLAKLAAIWTLFKLSKQIELHDFSLIGTQNWLSFAYLRAGAFWTLEGYKVKARQLYVEALNQDINHRSVLFNLGYLDIEDRDYDRAIERLSQAQELSEPGDSSKLPKDYLWYLATYQLAATHHYMGRLSDAEQEAKNLVDTLQKAKQMPAPPIVHPVQKKNEGIFCFLLRLLERFVHPVQKKNEDNALKEFLQKFELNAKIMHASIIADQDNIEKAELKVNDIKCKNSKFPYRVHYNFACYYSIVGNKTKGDTQTNAYNNALYHLKYALERGGDIIQWAQKDPSLIGVREDKIKKDEFYEIIKKYGTSAEQEDSLPLSGLAIIGDYAKQLKEQGIVSHCDLLRKADTPSAQEALAKKLGISTTLLRRWTLLADLMRIVGDTQYVNLLEAADAGSLDALKKVSDPCELANLLKQVNQAQSLVKQLPSMETVQQWVQDARQTKPKVL